MFNRPLVAPAAAFILAFSVVPAAVHSAAPPAATQAQQPKIASLDVNADAGLRAGSVLRFRLVGTPKGSARIQVPGSKVALPLTETQPGIYTGDYTVRRGDTGLTPASLVRAQLTLAGATQITDFSLPASFGTRQAGGGAQAAAGPRINSFTTPSADKPLPGAEIRFVVDGTPGATVSVAVPGLPSPIAMRETRPGHYVGTYVVRRADTLQPGAAVATLRVGETTTTAKLGQPASNPAAAASAPAPALTLEVTQPASNTNVYLTETVVQGRTAPNATVGVQVDAAMPVAGSGATVPRTILRTKVTANAAGNFSVPLASAQRVDSGTEVAITIRAGRGQETTPGQRVMVVQR